MAKVASLFVLYCLIANVHASCKYFQYGLCPGAASCMCTSGSQCSLTGGKLFQNLSTPTGGCSGECKVIEHNKCPGGNDCLYDTGISCGNPPPPPPPHPHPSPPHPHPSPPPSPHPHPSPPPSPSGCSSMLAVTAKDLTCVYHQLSPIKAVQYAPAISLKMGLALGNKCAWAAFLANVGTESNGLTEWTQDPCNGATDAPYCGRGPLQITGKSNYAFCAGKGVCGCSDIVNNPEKVSDETGVGVGTAACVWEDLAGHSLSRDADGTLTGLLKTACYINAGHYPCSPNGWQSREDYWHKANDCLGVMNSNSTEAEMHQSTDNQAYRQSTENQSTDKQSTYKQSTN